MWLLTHSFTSYLVNANCHVPEVFASINIRNSRIRGAEYFVYLDHKEDRRAQHTLFIRFNYLPVTMLCTGSEPSLSVV